jgi:hypothetical protein
MRCIPFLAVLLLFGGIASAQEPVAGGDLPVSLDHIRDALNRPPATWTLKFDVTSDFRTEIHEQQKLEELARSLDFKSGPVPAGGVYMDEQQRVMNNATNNPLRQPYAAFNAGELITLTVESLAERYLGGHAHAASTADRDNAEARARADVLHAIAEFCDGQPDSGAGQPICASQFETTAAPFGTAAAPQTAPTPPAPLTKQAGT